MEYIGNPTCCCGGCDVLTDDFNRANNDDPGANWDEVGGDWDILDNQLNGVSEGVLITTRRQQSPKRGSTYNLRFTVELIDFPASGTKEWKVICGYVDPTNFDWIEFAYVAATGDLTPTFYRRTAGVDSAVLDPTNYPGGDPWSFPPETAAEEFEICYAAVQWSAAHIGAQSDVYWEICGGGKASLPADTDHGLIGFLAGDFDNLVYEVHWESDPECEYCECFCLNAIDASDWNCLAETLTATLTANTGYVCPAMDGLSLEMYQSDPDVGGASPVYDANPQKKTWFSEIFTIEGSKHWLVMQCDAMGLSMGCLAYPNTAIGTCATYLFFPSPCPEDLDTSVSTCDPLSLVFRDLTADVTTCDLDEGDEGYPGTGTRARPCPAGDCMPEGEYVTVTWDVTVTE